MFAQFGDITDEDYAKPRKPTVYPGIQAPVVMAAFRPQAERQEQDEEDSHAVARPGR